MFINKTPTSQTKNTSNNQNQLKSKKYFKENKLSGLYQDYDQKTGKLKQQGNYKNGVQTGKWRVIDQDGDQIHYQYSLVRVGAICNDGTQSTATGRGACSWHGGVAQWLYDTVKMKIGGTGKYIPIQQRVSHLKNKIKQQFKINKQGLQFQQAIYKLLLNLSQQNQQLSTQIGQLQQQLQQQKIINQNLQQQLHQQQKQHQKSKLITKNISDTQISKIQTKSNSKNQSIKYGQKNQQPVFINRVKKQSQIIKKEQAKKQPPQKFEKNYPQQDQSNSQEYESDNDDKGTGQIQLIKQLFQKINLK